MEVGEWLATLGVILTGREHEGASWGLRNALYLDLYKRVGVYNSSSCALKIYALHICVSSMPPQKTNKKNFRKNLKGIRRKINYIYIHKSACVCTHMCTHTHTQKVVPSQLPFFTQ